MVQTRTLAALAVLTFVEVHGLDLNVASTGKISEYKPQNLSIKF